MVFAFLNVATKANIVPSLVRIYRGKGVDPKGLRECVKSLEHCAQPIQIEMIKPHEFLSTEWEKNCDVLLFPGGRDLPYVEALQGEACSRIRDFVLSGGRFFGICAGAYFASSFVEFEKGEELEITGHRELSFFPGRAVGPVFEKNRFRYHSLEGARSAWIDTKKTQLPVFYHGGCYFEEAENFSQVEILATYAEKLLPAIVLCQVGRGKALLSGVHLEYRPRLFQNTAFFKDLAISESQRVLFLKDLWSFLIKN